MSIDEQVPEQVPEQVHEQVRALSVTIADRDTFLRLLVRNLAGVLEDVVGLHDAEGFISIVGERIGEQFHEEYTRALGVEHLTKSQIAAVLVDLKRRIQGDFYVIEQREDRIVFGNRRCPFGEMVRDRPSMCMMTSNVFGKIAAENQGYARVELAETIAAGDPGCRVTVFFNPSSDYDEATREYFRTMD